MFTDWEHAADILRRKGAVVLLPTETVYGLTGRAADPECREKIVTLKHRDPAKHIGWFVSSLRQLEERGYFLDRTAKLLAERFMPGPLTLIVKHRDGHTTGFRIPSHPQLLELLKELDEPLLQTSANRSGMPDALDCAAALEMLDGEPDAAIDGGAIPPGAKGSTIVDCTGEKPVILRQGALYTDDFLSSI